MRYVIVFDGLSPIISTETKRISMAFRGRERTRRPAKTRPGDASALFLVHLSATGGAVPVRVEAGRGWVHETTQLLPQLSELLLHRILRSTALNRRMLPWLPPST